MDTTIPSPSLQLPIPPQFPGYRLVRVRLETFNDWPVDYAFIDTNTLAESGFYYAGHTDAVRCFHCGCELRSWQAGDDPHTIHRHYSPQCDFLRERHSVDNVSQELPVIDLRSPRLGSLTHYQAVLVEVRRLGYAQDAVHGALHEYVRRGQSLNNLGREHLEAILQEWHTPLCLEALQAENRRLRKKTWCQICERKFLQMLLFDCHHLMCITCANRYTRCPVCDARIRDRVRIFM